MTAQQDKPKRRVPFLVWMLVPAALLFAGANVHLVYVALESQPGCVPHLKDAGAEHGGFRAAKSAC